MSTRTKDESSSRSQLQSVVLDRYLTLKEVKAHTGLKGTTTIYVRMNAGTFPKAIPVGGRQVRWSAAEIQRWMEQQRENRDNTA